MPSTATMPRWCTAMWWLLPAVIAAGTTASAEDPQGASREELVERWDLDGNGTIDESEAVLARSRMRRARRELEMQSSIDPLTGRPRDLDAETAEPVEEPKAPPPPPPRRRSPEEPPLPGTRVPDMKRPATPERPVPPSAGQNSGSRIRTPDSRRPAASRTPTPSPRSGSVVGGVRAGAPAARPGYGAAVPFSDLNAGRSRVASGPMPEQASRAARGRLSGGLVPSPVLPPTADGLARGGRYTGRPAGSPPVAPTPTLPRPPRMTAEDIGGP